MPRRFLNAERCPLLNSRLSAPLALIFLLACLVWTARLRRDQMRFASYMSTVNSGERCIFNRHCPDKRPYCITPETCAPTNGPCGRCFHSLKANQSCINQGFNEHGCARGLFCNNHRTHLSNRLDGLIFSETANTCIPRKKEGASCLDAGVWDECSDNLTCDPNLKRCVRLETRANKSCDYNHHCHQMGGFYCKRIGLDTGVCTRKKKAGEVCTYDAQGGAYQCAGFCNYSDNGESYCRAFALPGERCHVTSLCSPEYLRHESPLNQRRDPLMCNWASYRCSVESTLLRKAGSLCEPSNDLCYGQFDLRCEKSESDGKNRCHVRRRGVM